jgi:hypothetical protein
MSVDLSGEITAIATAVLAVFAIVTAIYTIREWSGLIAVCVFQKMADPEKSLGPVVNGC